MGIEVVVFVSSQRSALVLVSIHRAGETNLLN
jgi:hypothetical protein